MRTDFPARAVRCALLVCVAFAALLAAGQPVRAGSVIYVVPGGAGAGTSWGDGKSLSAALAGASSGDEVWVKAGVYRPDTTGLTDPRTATFSLKTGVAVYGGFGGTEATREERNPQANVTTLSGDLLGNDTTTPTTWDDNAYHVVTAVSVDGSAILDGFTITRGVAAAATGICPGILCGGGVFNQGGGATYRNLNITANRARGAGGGMFTFNSSPTLTNIVFTNNTAAEGYLVGGGMYINSAQPVLTNVSFIENGDAVLGYGGGLVINNSWATLTNVTFKLNQAQAGGGLYVTNSGTPTLTNVSFVNNQADYEGGGLYSDSLSAPTLVNALFIGNYGRYGGGVSSQGSQVNLVNATFNGNLAERGGAVYTDNNSSRATDVPTLTSSILWGDGATTPSLYPPTEIYNASGRASVSYSLVQGGYPGMGNLDADPKFISPVDPNTGATANANLRLGPGSPAIDAGDPTAAIPPLPTADLDGKPRIVHGHVDMGVYEVPDPTPPVITVTCNGQPCSAGWYTTTVNVVWSVTDAQSSILSSTGCDSISISADTSGAVLTCSATSGGGTNTVQVSIKRDTTPPSVTRNPSADACALPGANGWCRGAQTAGFTVSDGGSSVASPCSGAACSFTRTSTSNGTAVSIASGQVCDTAGNCAAGIDAGPFKIDSAAPTLSPTVSPNPAPLGGAATASPNASDALSGIFIQSCGPVDTSTVGTRSVNCAATDNAGNTATARVSYTVGYRVSYVLPTLGPPGVNALYPVALGAVFTPVRWRLTNASGGQVTTATVAAVRYTSMTCGGTAPNYSDAYPMAGGFSPTNPTYDGRQGLWLFNWQLPSARGCYALFVRYSGDQVIPFLYRIY